MADIARINNAQKALQGSSRYIKNTPQTAPITRLWPVPLEFSERSKKFYHSIGKILVNENPATGRPITDVKTSWIHAIKEAGLDGKPGVNRLRIHDLRHTAATRLMRNTKNMKLVAQYLGHTDIKTTARYLHPDDGDLAAAAESLVRKVTPKLTPRGKKRDYTKLVSIQK